MLQSKENVLLALYYKFFWLGLSADPIRWYRIGADQRAARNAFYIFMQTIMGNRDMDTLGERCIYGAPFYCYLTQLSVVMPMDAMRQNTAFLSVH